MASGIRTFERGMGCFLWAVLLGMPLAIGAALTPVAISSGEVAMAVAAVAIGGLGLLMGPGIIALLVWGKRNSTVSSLLESLRARLGGELSMASMLNPVAQPRLTTSLRGVGFEVAVLRLQSSAVSYAVLASVEREHARTNAQLLGGRHQATIKLDGRAPCKLSLVSRTSMSGMLTGVFGLVEVRSGHPGIDERFAVYSDQPAWALGFLRTGDNWARVESLMTVNYPFLTQLYLGPDALRWSSPLTDRITPEVVGWIGETMLDCVSRMAGR